jgi:Kef-type K+ transport system membrane component KefB
MPTQPVTIFLLELLVIMAASRAVGYVARRYLGQPAVVAEMITGVLLGPSLLGLVAPGLEAALFPKGMMGTLSVVAQFGAGLYMFLVGLRFRPDHLRVNIASASAVSLTGMIVPFLAALVITPWLIATPGLFGAHVTLIQATLFMGACIAITAFPVLARIIDDRGLSGTPLGTLCLSAGAINDGGAWIVLAIVLSTLSGDPTTAAEAIGGAALVALLLLRGGPRLLAPLARRVERDAMLDLRTIGTMLMLFLLCAASMDAIGMHAVLGGFLVGVATPRGRLADLLRERLEPLVVLVLLPVFFMYSGLNTQLNLVIGAPMMVVTVTIIAVSILAKGGACWAAARLAGQDRSSALAIGALMNARGLMELVMINIGLQRGIIGAPLFSMLTLMTIVTTLMVSPLFELSRRRSADAGESPGAAAEEAGAG